MSRQLQEQQEALENHAAELKQAVEDRTEQLRVANRRKDEFIATLSHELRNPLAPIWSGLEILQMEVGSNRETVSLIQEQLRHLVRLVDDLLDTSRIMQGKIELRKEPVELSVLIDQSTKAIRPMLDRREQDFVAVLPEEPIWLNADRVRLIQVIENLLNNADQIHGLRRPDRTDGRLSGRAGGHQRAGFGHRHRIGAFAEHL